MNQRQTALAYLLLSPFLITFAIFLLIPVVYSLWLSFHSVSIYSDLFNVFGDLRFVGFRNYSDLLEDNHFLFSMLLTMVYAAITIPGTILFSLCLALLLNNSLPGKSLFRSAFFLPNILDMLVVGFVWQLIYSPKFGFLTVLLEKFLHIHTFHDSGFLANPYTALPAIALAMILKGAGFGMILFLASLNNIPKDLFEAASIDGANRLEIFLNVTLPQLIPTILFLIVTGIMAALNGFTEIYAMSSGGPQFVGNRIFGGETLGATRIAGYYLWQVFSEGRYGYAAAMSYMMLLFALFISYINVKFLQPRMN